MKKQRLTGLSLNKKSIVNFATLVGGNRVVTAPSNYDGCVDSINVCVNTGLCATGAQCEIESFLCTNYQCETLDQCQLQTTIFPIC